MTAKELYSSKIISIIDNYKAVSQNQIFVILGQTTLLNIDNQKNNFADPETFKLDRNENTFNREWFTKTFTTLNLKKSYHILSFAQFSYLIYYIDPSFFNDRVVIIKDNLRQLYPIRKDEYIEKEEKENIELRPDELPIYQAEQITINGKHYYSVKTPINSFSTVDMFTETSELGFSNNQVYDTIDISSDPYSIDVFVNECFRQDDFNKTAIVKFYNKQPLNVAIILILKQLNSLLNQFGGKLFILEDAPIAAEYQVADKTNELLIKFWGETANFRNMAVYKNPNIGSEIAEISQGLVVDTIVKEYENSIVNEPCRDLFLTAPTGAGKSLLFQLPAFYISEKGDVTIVVSPLIALMKDQVNAIIKDRNFDKVAYINSELSLIDRERIIEGCKSGEIDILYMSPELLLSYDITHFIGFRRLGLIVIDEAHLITTWGRDFRVDYWFLGNHIRKIRKYHNLHFPMVAVTATAIYGGANDMVFDSIDSLVMHNPHIFIGQVKRNDIEFIVNNYERFTVNYESNKITQTVDFIKKINEIGLKTLVYTPYTRHIQQILEQLSAEQLNIATGYYGSLDSLNKEFSYRQFKCGERKIMISTKAFGMGVDISDIQVVYHHAPSGLLPDYVQEIGRVARKPEIKGFATLNYSSQDQRYTKALHGMSALKQYQIKEVLKKIHKAYLKNDKNRNLLLSVDDFGHIFENALDLDQKVLTALMMIEKDYLAKNRFNVIIARPKKLFVKVYARISDLHLPTLNNKYANTYKLLSKSGNGNSVIEMDLDRLWHDFFNNKSFPILKRDFYTGYLFKEDNINLVPQLKISFERLDSFNSVFNKLQSLLNTVQDIFANSDGYFKQDIFQLKLNNVLQDLEKAEKLSKFILSSYSGKQIQPGVIEGDAFLQQRRSIDGFEYRVFNTKHLQSFNALLTRLNNLFSNTESTKVERFVTNKESNAINYVRLGYFLEILELGTFEIKGGENPMIFIRINDPNRIERDSNYLGYTNSLLSKTLERHYLSNEIFDHFFLRSFTNLERWNFIEDFFLGSDVDLLLEKFKGGEANNIDILDTLKKKDFLLVETQTKHNDDSNVHIFHPSADRFYFLKDLITIHNDNGIKTMRISEWLREDPIAFDIVRRENTLKVNKEVFEILISKLKAYHPQYFIDALGLKARISFKGYDRIVQAIVPYSDRPVEFYKWWIDNPDSVNLTLEEKVKLFDKVYMLKPTALKREHRRLLKK
ncbi:MAG: ATP-dependent DNA helicase RecQ [Bacteroidales bacterium]|nr:ATP-dependent DNA helicase RecQ [Bacteroidales bacterium]